MTEIKETVERIAALLDVPAERIAVIGEQAVALNHGQARRLMLIAEGKRSTTTEKLTSAFHALFDVKDSMIASDPARYSVYEAIGKIDEAMRLLGIDPPRRFDAPPDHRRLRPMRPEEIDR